MASAAGAAWLVAGAAQADPTVYEGTLGKAAIVVEFADDPAVAGPTPAGRYFYRSKGVDIPLLGVGKGRSLVLTEEEACDADACPAGTPGPVAATWTLSPHADGGLSGTWKGAGSPLKIVLARVGSRAAPADHPATPFGLHAFSDDLFFSDAAAIDDAISPYDRLRLDAALTLGAVTRWGDVAFRLVTDPRSKFGYPRIVAAGDTDIGPANRLLEARQKKMTLSALNCAALRYASFADPDGSRGPGGGDLAGYDETTNSVDFLTPRLLGWTESGSLYCGGAYPENFSNAYLVDVASGRLVGNDELFRDWTAETPSPALVAFVREHRPKPTDEPSVAFERDCGIDDLIAQNLAPRPISGDGAPSLVFGLEGLPHVIKACEENLLTVPIEEARPFLTPKGLHLFGLD
jgi:hypothetical protein